MSWMWGLLVIVTSVVVAWAFRLYRRDRLRARARLRDVLSPAVLAEIEQERAAALRRKERFAEALKAAEREQSR